MEENNQLPSATAATTEPMPEPHDVASANTAQSDSIERPQHQEQADFDDEDSDDERRHEQPQYYDDNDDYVPDDPYGDPNGVRGRRRARMRQPHPEDGDGMDETKRDPAMADACKEEGNRHYGKGAYDTAVACYTEALRACPRDRSFDERRAVYHGNRAACFVSLQKWEDALYDCDRALELKPEYAKALCRRAQALEALGLLEDAVADYEAWARLDGPNASKANKDVARVKQAMAARDEKLKEEMMGKLKDLGNSMLGYFGLSMDNFKAVKDPNTGSYSISFQQGGAQGQS